MAREPIIVRLVADVRAYVEAMRRAGGNSDGPR